MGYNYSIYVISALCGNAMAESGINAGRTEEETGVGYGLFQWSYTRRTNLETYCANNGYAVDNPEAQLDFLIYEGDWNQNPTTTYWSYSSSYTSLESWLSTTSTDYKSLTVDFEACWERPKYLNSDTRQGYAEDCYNYIVEHYNDGSISTWITSSAAISYSESLNNAVMLYRYYSGMTPPTPIPTTRKHMPIYFYLHHRIY